MMSLINLALLDPQVFSITAMGLIDLALSSQQMFLLESTFVSPLSLPVGILEQKSR